MIRKFLALAAALAALVSRDALAANATSDFTVTAKVNKTCSIATTSLAFGPYDPFSTSATPATNNKGVTLTCSKGTA